MSKLKLNTKNFSGEVSTKYKVSYRISDKGEISLTLKILFNDKWLDADTIMSNDFLRPKDDSKSNLEYVLSQAETQWGLQLTKAKLNVA